MNPRKEKPTNLERLVFLQTLRDHGSEKANEALGFTVDEGRYYRRQLRVHIDDKDEINRAIYKLESKINGTSDYLARDYKKQASCTADKFYFKCHSCQFTGSENNIDEVLEHINRCKEKLKVGVRVFDLTGNKVEA